MKVEELTMSQLDPGSGSLCEMCEYRRCGEQCSMVHPILQRHVDGNEVCSHFLPRIYRGPMLYGLAGSTDDFALLGQELKRIKLELLGWQKLPTEIRKNHH